MTFIRDLKIAFSAMLTPRLTLFFSLVVSVAAEGEFSILDVIMMSDGFALLQWS